MGQLFFLSLSNWFFRRFAKSVIVNVIYLISTKNSLCSTALNFRAIIWECVSKCPKTLETLKLSKSFEIWYGCRLGSCECLLLLLLFFQNCHFSDLGLPSSPPKGGWNFLTACRLQIGWIWLKLVHLFLGQVFFFPWVVFFSKTTLKLDGRIWFNFRKLVL